MTMISSDDLAGRVALVSGATGFIGSHLCRRLQSRGARVHGTGRRKPSGLEAGIEYEPIDLAAPGAAAELMRAVRPDFVFHLASHVQGSPDFEHVLPTFRSNLQTTVNLLAAATEVGCERMIVTGSLVEPEAATERVPSSPYAAAKWASSDYSRMFHALYDLPVVIARVFMVYGPAQQDETKLVPYTIRSLARGEAPEITSGRRQIDWVYVDDVVAGLITLALAPGLEGDTVDLGSGSLITTADLVEMICSLMKSAVRPRLGALADRPLEPVRVARVADTTALTGWAPKVSLEQGLARTIGWYSDTVDQVAHG
jgi:nucleoside-diphosphate-sugar epimerase